GPGQVIVNTRNGASLQFLDPDDIVEVPALVHGGGVSPLAVGQLPRSARGLITQTKQYERDLVDAAVSGDADLAALALALHPLVRAPGPPGPVRWAAGLGGGPGGARGGLPPLRLGGQAARQRDGGWPLEYGWVGQETTGAGGFAKALRTVPVVLDIAERARRR